MHRQGQGQEDEQAVTKIAAKREFLLANGKAGNEEQCDRDSGEPTEVAVSQRHAVTEGKKGQKRPWQGEH
ncbi:hypothetical protein D3C85_1607370 [compost metagenome]